MILVQLPQDDRHIRIRHKLMYIVRTVKDRIYEIAPALLPCQCVVPWQVCAVPFRIARLPHPRHRYRCQQRRISFFASFAYNFSESHSLRFREVIMYLPHQRHSSIMRDGESLNQKKSWPLSSALRPFCSAKPAVVGRYLHSSLYFLPCHEKKEFAPKK